MITKRIIPCLDVKNGRVVKGVQFEGLSDVASPVELAKYYSDHGADELVFYDITASAEGRKLFTDILTEVASRIFIPLTVGGGINTIDDFARVLGCGADKVSVNSGAIANPSLITEAAEKYGSQCVVLSADVKRVGASSACSPRAAAWIRASRPLSGSVRASGGAPARSCSIPSIRTASRAALIRKCWLPFARSSTFPSSPRAVPAKRKILLPSLIGFPPWTRPWPPRCSTSGRSALRS